MRIICASIILITLLVTTGCSQTARGGDGPRSCGKKASCSSCESKCGKCETCKASCEKKKASCETGSCGCGKNK